MSNQGPDTNLGAGLSLAEDELGESVSILIDTRLYGKASVFKTAYWATERAFLYLNQTPDAQTLTVEVRSKDLNNHFSLSDFAREFCNALIDQQTRQLVLQETSVERNALLTKAFGAGRNHLDPEAIA
jgi:His-Xaa-Ser system protein HxsD